MTCHWVEHFWNQKGNLFFTALFVKHDIYYIGGLGVSENNIWNSSWPKKSAQVELICKKSALIDMNWCKNQPDLHKFSLNLLELVQKSTWLVHI